MNGFDFVILLTCGICTILGIYWGLIRQILAVVGLLVGIIIAGRYGSEVAAWLSSFIASDMLAGALGFLLVLVSVSALASLVASLLRLFVGLLFLGWLDHVLGGGLGFIQAVLICATILLVAITFPLPAWQTAVDQSHLADPVLRIGWLLLPLLQDEFRQALQLIGGG